MATRDASPRLARGMVLVEVLVTATVVAIGIVGLARIQARTVVMQMEAQQRTQALLLAHDMADRLVANRTNVAAYLGSDYGADDGICDVTTIAGSDRCAWNTAIRGTYERLGVMAAGGLRNGRGCVTSSGSHRYRVSVVWQGAIATVAPAVDCARGTYGSDAQRRAVVIPVELPDLSAN